MDENTVSLHISYKQVHWKPTKVSFTKSVKVLEMLQINYTDK